MQAKATNSSVQTEEASINISQLRRDANLSELATTGSDLSATPYENMDFADIQQNFSFTMSSEEWPDTSKAEIDVNSLPSQVDDKFPDIVEIRELYVLIKYRESRSLTVLRHQNTDLLRRCTS